MSEINSEETWSKSCRKFEKKSNQTNIFYWCNKVKQRSKIQWSTGLVIICLADSLEVEIQRTLCVHDHISRIHSVSLEAKAQIEQMFPITNILTPQAILENLEKFNKKIKLET